MVWEFEREIIRERNIAGIRSAKARGGTGGRKPELSKEALIKADSAKLLLDQGIAVSKISAFISISITIFYRYIDRVLVQTLKSVELEDKNDNKLLYNSVTILDCSIRSYY